MIEPVRITETIEHDFEMQDFWVMRAIRDVNGKKEVIEEHILENEPTKEQIANFLYTFSEAAFTSVEHNYRLLYPF